MNHRWKQILCLVSGLSFTLLSNTTAFSAETHEKAISELANRVEWRRLLHYEKRFGLFDEHSLVDDPKFFFSPRGVRDPVAELEATLEALRSTSEVGDDHPQCRFPARYRWIRDNASHLLAEVNEVPCVRLQEWIRALDPGRLSLVFPTSYLNNPASLYGHTLLKIDPESYGKDGAILGYGINYAAAAHESEGLMFAVKGLLGGYHGYFSVLPYYVQLRRYSDIESRDIWEYELNFTKEEILRLLFHLWELRGTYFDYYFFDENCAYHLLSLLEVGRPSLELTDSFPLWVIPSDTVKVVVENPGIVEQEKYRPSNGTKLLNYLNHLSSEELSLARAIVASQGEVLSSDDYQLLSEQERANTLEVSLDFLDYAVVSGDLSLDEAEGLRWQMLSQKSRLPTTTLPPIAPPVAPVDGHPSRRFSVQTVSSNDRLFGELDFRSAYHSLLDSPGGFPRGAEIEFFRISARYREESGVSLERFIPVSILSVSPRNAAVQPMSWSFSFGAERILPDTGSVAGFVKGGPGLSYSLDNKSFAYILSDVAFEVSGHHEHRFIGGFGIHAGAVRYFSDRSRGQLSLKGMAFVIQADEAQSDVKYEHQYDLTKSLSLYAVGRSLYRADENALEAGIGVRWYF